MSRARLCCNLGLLAALGFAPVAVCDDASITKARETYRAARLLLPHDPKAALALLQEAREHLPDSPDVLYYAAEATYQLGEFAEAQRLADVSLMSAVTDEDNERAGFPSSPEFAKLVELRARLGTKVDDGMYFQKVDDAVIREVNWEVDWSARDNGRDVNWHEASAWCQALSGSWRLPTERELKGIFHEEWSVTCGVYLCRTSPKFELTRFAFWGDAPAHETRAPMVSLTLGGARSYHKDSTGGRALCIRNSAPAGS